MGMPIDPLARSTVLGIAAGRIAIGLGAIFATAPALRVLGFPEPDAPARALGELAGSRDLVLGVLPFTMREDPERLRSTAIAAAVVDALDAATLGFEAIRHRELGRAGILGALSGGTAAATGIWAARRL